MKIVFKYPVSDRDRFYLELPKGAKILSFQCQGEQPCLWALVDTDVPTETRHFLFIDTGQPIVHEPIGKLNFIGTVQMAGDTTVGHLFEIV